MEGEENKYKCKERVIMVGMDESEESTKALQWAFHRLSTPQDRLLIINAQRPASSYVKAGGSAVLMSGEMLKIFEEGIKRSTQNIFTRARDVCKEKNVVTETMAMTGDARDVLCDAVKKYKPDMLVVGSHGYGPIKSLQVYLVKERRVDRPLKKEMGDAKRSIVVGVDDSEQSAYALEWTLDHLLAHFNGDPPFKLYLIHAKPSAASVLAMTGPGAVEVLPMVDTDLKRIGSRALEQAKGLCHSRAVQDIEVEMVEGDARNVLCDAVERHGAEMLVVGSHGYGAIKRAVLGSVSDYCAHHCKCTVMIVKKPKH